MTMVWITALAVGLSTVLGSFLSFKVTNVPKQVENIFMSFAAGIMLGATFISLLVPAIAERGDLIGNIMVAGGLIIGAIVIAFTDRFVPHIHHYMNMPVDNKELDAVILFIIAIAIHNFPEGMAVGVSFGDNVGSALAMAIGISIQNVPEGLVTILPLILAGVSKRKAFTIGLFTGLIEVIGVLVGYFAVGISSQFLPFILAFAGGSMLFVISHDMIPATQAENHEDKLPTYALIVGVASMIMVEYLGGLLA